MRRLGWLAAVAFGLVASAAAAEDEKENLVKYLSPPTEAVRRAALPPGAPSTVVILSCLGDRDHFTNCKVTEQKPPGREDVGLAGAKFAEAQKYEPLDRLGKPVAGRQFEVQWEMLAPGDSNPTWVRRPTLETIASAAPALAARDRKSGKGVMACVVTVTGALDKCRVASETPEGYGFGRAALILASQFMLTPRIRGGVAVPGRVEITVLFDMSDIEAADVSPMRIISDPPWAKSPTAEQMRAAYPPRAADIAFGQAAMRCFVNDQGGLRGCDVTSEIPPGKGFGQAARSLIPNFVIAFNSKDKGLLKSVAVDLPFRFRNPTAPDNGGLTDPRWTRTLSVEGAAALYPAAAVKAGVKTGVGVVDCVATGEGDLTDCKVAREDPASLGFGEAALEAAKVMTMNPWSKTGEPVEGRRVLLPIRLQVETLAPAEAPSEPPKP